MFCFGLIGFPIQNSLSPAIHSAAFKSVGLNGEYNLYSCPQTSNGHSEITKILTRMRNGDIHGLNITIPHKQTIKIYLDKLTSRASSIGAVNTVYTLQNGLVGDNTDASGFYYDLCRVTQGRLNIKTALILGAGGSARGVCHILLVNGWKVIIAARSKGQANQLITEQKKIFSQDGIEISLQAIKLDEIQAEITDLSDVTLVVNCTPLGMNQEIELTSWIERINIPSRAFAYDLVYTPIETRFMRFAKSHGCQSYNGMGMLLEQALLAFEIWTGVTPNRQDVLLLLKDEGVIE